MLWNRNKCGGKKNKVTGISRQQYPIQIMIDQKEPENVECTNYSGSMITKDEKCTLEIKSRIVMEKRHSSR
jgi:hypothetical protein